MQSWLPGAAATREDPAGSEGFAHDLAELIADLRGIDAVIELVSPNPRGSRGGGAWR
ncbi:hypothetical protein [Pseudonocardia sp. MH-G8]|uniref:hypothetical protein n=1 Tax=Pseudonocardia sp. MH-G8 TaxID=1854588 RepID=UPI0013044B24|nr:hypothetical protein [Pseudonocardia sp. MH-G8]